jgi:hypothetical protein
MKHTIQVRRYQAGQTKHGSEHIGAITGNFGKFDVVETVKLTLWAEQIGNFNPIFCKYKCKRTLVHSDDGDLSDPFRREESYAKTLFISI